MLDDAGDDAPEFDPPDADRVYANYLETCRRAGVRPVSRERAQDLIAWTAVPQVVALDTRTQIGDGIHVQECNRTTIHGSDAPPLLAYLGRMMGTAI